MLDSVDWTDTRLRSLAELASIAFPKDLNVTAETLKRRARQGRLTVYRPGKALVSTLADVWQMVQSTKRAPASRGVAAETAANPLGLSAIDLASMALDRELARLRTPSQTRPGGSVV